MSKDIKLSQKTGALKGALFSGTEFGALEYIQVVDL
jgi:hypothetical protein